MRGFSCTLYIGSYKAWGLGFIGFTWGLGFRVL